MMDTRIQKLRNILKSQIKWYQANEQDTDLVYDEMWRLFMELKRGDYVDIMELLMQEDTEE